MRMVEFYEKGILKSCKTREMKGGRKKNDITSPCDVLQYYFSCYPF